MIFYAGCGSLIGWKLLSAGLFQSEAPTMSEPDRFQYTSMLLAATSERLYKLYGCEFSFV